MVVGLIAWLVWAIIKAILDAGDCYQSGDLCVCRDERGNVQSFPVDGKTTVMIKKEGSRS